jgi:hypothetical protein
MSQDVLGHTAHDQPGDAGAAMRSHHDQISADLTAEANDFIGGIGCFAEPALDGHIRRNLDVIQLFPGVIEKHFGLGRYDALAIGDCGAENDVCHDDGCAIVARERAGELERVFGVN